MSGPPGGISRCRTCGGDCEVEENGLGWHLTAAGRYDEATDADHTASVGRAPPMGEGHGEKTEARKIEA